MNWVKLTCYWLQDERVCSLDPVTRLGILAILTHLKNYGAGPRAPGSAAQISRCYNIPLKNIQEALTLQEYFGADEDTIQASEQLWAQFQFDSSKQGRQQRYRDRSKQKSRDGRGAEARHATDVAHRGEERRGEGGEAPSPELRELLNLWKNRRGNVSPNDADSIGRYLQTKGEPWCRDVLEATEEATAGRAFVGRLKEEEREEAKAPRPMPRAVKCSCGNAASVIPDNGPARCSDCVRKDRQETRSNGRKTAQSA